MGLMECDKMESKKCIECRREIVYLHEGPGEIAPLYLTHDESYNPVGYRDDMDIEGPYFYCPSCFQKVFPPE